MPDYWDSMYICYDVSSVFHIKLHVFGCDVFVSLCLQKQWNLTRYHGFHCHVTKYAVTSQCNVMAVTHNALPWQPLSLQDTISLYIKHILSDLFHCLLSWWLSIKQDYLCIIKYTYVVSNLIRWNVFGWKKTKNIWVIIQYFVEEKSTLEQHLWAKFASYMLQCLLQQMPGTL